MSERVTLTGPLGYRENLSLMAAARVELTDSGGVQEEASALGIPCLILRENTERPITTVLGTNTLVGIDPSMIRRYFFDVVAGRYKAGVRIPLWDGRAAERAAEAIRSAWHIDDPEPAAAELALS